MEEPPAHLRADWPYIQNGAITLFSGQGTLNAAIEAMQSEGYVIEHIDCSTAANLIHDFARALNWSERFGYEPELLNLDALNDALRADPRDGPSRIVLALTRFDDFQERDRPSAWNVLDMIETNSRDHMIDGGRLLAFVHVTDPQTEITGLGARSAQWNPKEWLITSRGD